MDNLCFKTGDATGMEVIVGLITYDIMITMKIYNKVSGALHSIESPKLDLKR
jgi:hypothetical protein